MSRTYLQGEITPPFLLPANSTPTKSFSPTSSSFFPSSPPIDPVSAGVGQSSPCLPYQKDLLTFTDRPQTFGPLHAHHNQYHKPRPRSPITTYEGVDAILMAACEVVEKENEENLSAKPDDTYSEAKENEAFLADNLASDKESSEEDWEEANPEKMEVSDRETILNTNSQPLSARCRRSDMGINACGSKQAKEKLLAILKGEICIPRQRWGIEQIFAT